MSTAAIGRPKRSHLVAFSPPVGPQRAYLLPFPDQVLYPRTMGAQTVFARLMGLSPEFRGWLGYPSTGPSPQIIAL
jgi:hypothetical protein